MARDLHQALKTEVLSRKRSPSADISLVKLQWGKDEIAFSLHVSPHTFSTAGWQTTDFLAHLGFTHSGCAFNDQRQCYVREVESGFDTDRFAQVFDPAYQTLLAALSDLEACGFFLEQPEGWQFFTGRARSRSRIDLSMGGDGHTAMKHQSMKVSEDDTFEYRFTWLESAGDKGWVIHYRPKHLPLSSELQSVLKFLGLKDFNDCPEFDFESCYWRSIAFHERERDIFGSNANVVHGWFDAHSTRFSTGIEKLLSTNAQVETLGLRFLPFDKPAVRVRADIAKRITRSKTAAPRPESVSFDVAISFAGTERAYAEQLATLVRDAGLSVFYDDFYPDYLWGKNLVDTFDEIYRKNSRHCVMFVSKEYKERMWTNHERQSAQARALKEKGSDYILPIQIDDTELPGMPPTIGYIAISRGITDIASLLIKKLKS